MTDIATIDQTVIPAEVIEPIPAPEAVIAFHVAEGKRAARMLRLQLERLHERQVKPENWSGADMVAGRSAHVGLAMARLQAVHVGAALALARLRDGGTVQRIIVQRAN